MVTNFVYDIQLKNKKTSHCTRKVFLFRAIEILKRTMPYGVLSSLPKLLGIIHIDNYYLGSMSIDEVPYLNKKRLQHTYKSSSIRMFLFFSVA